jgi:signal transduction histidine kinase
VTDGNQRSYDVFGEGLIGADIERLVPGYGRAGSTDETEGITLTVDGDERYYQCKVSPIRYGRRSEGEIIVLSDVTELRNKEEELELLIQIFSRVFRHNMRNDFNVIQGYADMVETRANGELSRLARKIDEKASKLLDQAIKARQIEEIFSSAETVSVSLRDLVEDVRSSFDGRSDVVIETVVDDVRVDVNPRFALALHELVHNAVVHHPDAEPVEIEIRSEQAESHVHLAVTDNGDGIPEYELAVLRSAEETTLRHGSGIGLWLIRAAVSRSDGTLSIDSTTAGTSIRIRLQKSTAPRQDPTD